MSDTPATPKKHKFPWMAAALLIAFGAAMAYSYYTPGNGIAWAENFEQAKAKSAETGLPILMDFSASWCPPCRAVKRNVWPTRRVQDVVNARVIPLEVDIDRNKELAGRYGVSSIPTFILVDAGGRPLAQTSGYLDADGMIAFVLNTPTASVTSTPPSVPLPPAHSAEAR